MSVLRMSQFGEYLPVCTTSAQLSFHDTHRPLASCRWPKTSPTDIPSDPPLFSLSPIHRLYAKFLRHLGGAGWWEEGSFSVYQVSWKQKSGRVSSTTSDNGSGFQWPRWQQLYIITRHWSDEFIQPDLDQDFFTVQRQMKLLYTLNYPLFSRRNVVNPTSANYIIISTDDILILW